MNVEQVVREEAYMVYLERGKRPGTPEGDWYKARFRLGIHGPDVAMGAYFRSRSWSSGTLEENWLATERSFLQAALWNREAKAGPQRTGPPFQILSPVGGRSGW